MAENQKSEWQEREVGALWKKQSRAGQKYLSGKVKVGGEEVSVVCFTNDNKKNPNHPDFRLYLSRDRTESTETETQAEDTVAVGDVL